MVRHGCGLGGRIHIERLAHRGTRRCSAANTCSRKLIVPFMIRLWCSVLLFGCGGPHLVDRGGRRAAESQKLASRSGDSTIQAACTDTRKVLLLYVTQLPARFSASLSDGDARAGASNARHTTRSTNRYASTTFIQHSDAMLTVFVILSGLPALSAEARKHRPHA